MWRQSSIPTSIFRELTMSGNEERAYTATSSSLVRSDNLLTTTTLRKYLVERGVTSSLHHCNNWWGITSSLHHWNNWWGITSSLHHCNNWWGITSSLHHCNNWWGITSSLHHCNNWWGITSSLSGDLVWSRVCGLLRARELT